MKPIIGIFALVFMSAIAIGKTSPRPSWFLFDENKKVWCGYANELAFQEQADKQKPLESARVRLISGVPSEITYQVQPESGDWTVIDNYNILPNIVKLKRATIYAQSGIQVIQEASIHGGISTKFRLISVKKADGSPGNASAIDYSSIPINTDVNRFGFLAVAKAMARRQAKTLCDTSSNTR